MKRRAFIKGCLSSSLILTGGQHATSQPITESFQGEPPLYGLISKMDSKLGDRDKLIEILLNGTKEMPGCKLYSIAADIADETGIWITEIWDSEESHKRSLQLPNVQKAISEGKPMIAGFGERHVVTPAGGVGVQI